MPIVITLSAYQGFQVNAFQNDAFQVCNLGWATVDDTQVPAWAAISDTQAPGWTSIPDTQVPNWTDISVDQCG